jgi:hypothetical protein
LGVPIEYTQPASQSVFGAAKYAETIQDILIGDEVPFVADEKLPSTRPERIEQLNRWLSRFPAFSWMKRQAVIASGYETFKRIQSRRRGDHKFSDDLATFRFWEFSVYALLFLNAKHKPPAISEQRQQAVVAADKLLSLAKATTLLKDAGIGYKESSDFLAALEQVSALTMVKRRLRTDSFSADRRYIQSLTWTGLHLFGDAPPALIYEMAALKVKNPDKVSITKQVSAYKKGRTK